MAKTIGSILVGVGLNTTKFQKDLKNLEYSLKRTATKLKGFGQDMTYSITAPFAIAGAAAVKLAMELEENFATIENLVGITGKTLQEFKDKLPQISAEVGISQAELSKGLFAVTSAGIRGSEALDLLKQAAKASQIGMGDVTNIARAATGIIQAYGTANITAAKAVDVMTSTVREGNLTAEDLAPLLGRVTGVAAQMGVSFEEVGGNIAAFTRLGVDAAEAVTALRGIMNTFLAPTNETRDALKSVGLSVDYVRNSIKGEGLAKTLVMLKQKFDGNLDGLGKLIPNVRALSGVLGVAGNQSKEYIQIVENIIQQNGIVNQGFKNVAESAKFKLKAALVDLQNVGISFGEVIMPTFIKFIETIKGVVKWMQNLTAEQKENIVKWGLFVAAIGPAILIIGTMVSALSKTLGLIRLITAALAASGWGLILIAVGVAAYTIYENLDLIKNKFADLYNNSELFRQGVIGIQKAFDILRGVITVAFDQLKDFFALIEGKKTNYDAGFTGLFKKGFAYGQKMATEWGKGFAKQLDYVVANIPEESLAGLPLFDKFKETEKDAVRLPEILKPIVETIKEIGVETEKVAKGSMKWLNEQITSITDKIQSKGLTGSPLIAAIKELVSYEKQVEKIKENIDALKTRLSGSQDNAPLGAIPTINSTVTPTTNPFTGILGGIKNITSEITPGISAAQQKVNEFSTSVKNALVDMVENGLMVAAEGFTDMFAAIATGGDVGGAFKGLLYNLMGILETFGRAAIKAGIAALGIEQAIKGIAGGWALAIAGGVALITFAKIAQLKINKSANVPGYASGGIFDDESLIRVGEYPGAKSNPEVVAPLDKLKDMLRLKGNNGMQLSVVIDSRLQGNDIRQAIRRTETKYNRL